MGMQVPCCMDTEMPSEIIIRSTSERSWRGIPRACAAEREQGSGRAPAARPCTYADINTAEILCGPGGWVYEGQKRNIHIARTYLGQKKNYSGMHFWARGYFVSTVGADEEVVRNYIKEQEKEDHRIQQLSLFR